MISARYILFDLDGTLIDPKLGITRSIQYALQKMGTPVPPETSLDWCIGPPLHLSLGKLLAEAGERAVRSAVTFFAERFETVGKYEARIYPQTAAALQRVRQLGYRALLATSKPQSIAEDILGHFRLLGYFKDVYGDLGDKGLLIGRLIEAEALDPGDALMVGDREHDIFAARKNAMRSAGVTYGYGISAELHAAAPDYLFDSLMDLAGSLAPVHPARTH